MIDKRFGYGMYFKRINIDIQKYIDRNLSKYDITKSQLDILHYLEKHPKENVCQKDLQDFFHLSNATINGLVNRLEQKGFLKRVRSTSDKRISYIQQTKKAEQIHDDIKVSIQKLEQIMIEGISKDEQDLLFELLDKVTMNIEKEESEC